MAERGIIMISQRESRRLSIIHKVIDKRLKQVDAANILCLSERQITVQEHINGNISLRYKNRALHSKEITNRPKRVNEGQKTYLSKLRKPYVPPKNHPQRKFNIRSHSQ